MQVGLTRIVHLYFVHYHLDLRYTTCNWTEIHLSDLEVSKLPGISSYSLSVIYIKVLSGGIYTLGHFKNFDILAYWCTADVARPRANFLI